MLQFIVSTNCITFSKWANLETLEYFSHMVIFIFLPLGYIRVLSIGNEHSFGGVSLGRDKYHLHSKILQAFALITS